MIYLTLVFCLAASPNDCQQVHVDDSFASMRICSFLAQPLAVMWVADHAGYELSGATCTNGYKPAPERAS